MLRNSVRKRLRLGVEEVRRGARRRASIATLGCVVALTLCSYARTIAAALLYCAPFYCYGAPTPKTRFVYGDILK